MTRPYRFFEVVGVELEYPTVRRGDLAVQSLVEPLFREMAGRPVSEVEYGKATFSNELADHVFEVKTSRPQRSLIAAEKILYSGVRKVSRVLRDGYDARLLPTAMHPLMDPATGRTWRRAGRPIYDAYAALFDLRTHGWMNVQSCHLNFPFGTEAETAALHNAVTSLLPYLPALTASSPVYEGDLGPLVDNRLGFYGRNQDRFPLHAGEIIPEYMTGYAQYRREILNPIYRALAGVPETERLRHEWVNSRGAIVRFMRDAIEIRVLDTQECVRMDIACAVFIRAALTTLTRELLEGRWSLPERSSLIEDYRAVVSLGRRAPVTASLWSTRKPRNAGRLLLELLERCSPDAESGAVPYFGLVQRRLERGCLSERIRARLVGRRKTEPSPDRIRAVYSQLADCLEANEPWTQ